MILAIVSESIPDNNGEIFRNSVLIIISAFKGVISNKAALATIR